MVDRAGRLKLRIFLAGAGILGAALILSAVELFSAPLSAQRAASQALSAVIDRNPNRLWKLIPPEEVSAYGLTKDKLAKLMSNWPPNLNLKPKGSRQQEFDEGSGTATEAQWFTAAGRDPFPFSLDAQNRPGRDARVLYPVTSAIYMQLYAWGLSMENGPKNALVLRGIELREKNYENMGINGVLDPQSGHMISWSELRSQMTQRYKRWQTEHGSSSP